LRTSAEAGARQLACTILQRVEGENAYASILLRHAQGLLGHEAESGLLQELVLGCLRHRSALDHVLQQTASRPPMRMDPAVRSVLRIGAYELLFLDRIPPFAAVASAVDSIKQHGGRGPAAFVNAVLRRVARDGRGLLPRLPAPGDVPALALFHSHPAWWVDRVVARLGWDDAVRLLEANNLPVRPVVRTNLARLTTEELSRKLAAEGVATEPGVFVPDALRVRRGSLARSDCLEAGLAWVQDEAAQLVPLLFNRPMGPYIADVCAAPGSKSMQLAEALPPGSSVLALDRNLGRLRRLVALTRRLGITGVYAIQAEMSRRPPLAPRFNQVLVDAPCSGTGTLRRHPEIRWRLRPQDLLRLAGAQGGLLERAASLVAAGGELVYSVCSMEPEEGEEVVRDFLARHEEFLPSTLPLQLPPQVVRGHFLSTSPALGGLDGFFAARLVRRRASS
jgi:16S rRNA (cytosine967-C5)-methyltransferase